jgi:hypothetical protein
LGHGPWAERGGTGSHKTIDGSRNQDYRWMSRNVTDYVISLTGGNLCNFDERWNLQKLEETLLLLLLGREVQKTKFI